MKKTMSNLFLPFLQGDSTDATQFGGTGLGLCITKQLIHLFHGDITKVESTPKKGTTFHWYVVLGVQETSPNMMEISPSEKAPSFHKQPTKKLEVLLAEDNKFNQVLFHHYISNQLFHNCDIASNGLEAVNYSKKKKYDVIFMDLQLPVMSGMVATRKILTEEDSNNKNTPIIALTAAADIDSRNVALESGMVDFIAKPFKLPTLEYTLWKHIFEESSSSSATGKLDYSMLKS